ncbi:MAG: serine/threonine protein phosphatase [Candidatus Aenigmarchaeota archaeon]|nr:serine/threonine protein phosphatase [Candidatus Aenigmarchaeota archaeon]
MKSLEPNLVELDRYRNGKDMMPRVYIGDTHGDYEATRKIAERFLPKGYLLGFLGDYGDRALKPNGSIKNLFYVLKLKTEYPNNVVLLRGNHETFAIAHNGNKTGDLKTDLIVKFGKRVGNEYLNAFNEMFAQMPYTAVSENGVIALHGGLPNAKNIDELRALPKGIKHIRDDPVAEQILWSDADPDIKYTKDGSRGVGFDFSKEFFDHYMDLLNKSILLRGHDQRHKGYLFGNRLLTLFTSERYIGNGYIQGRIVAIDEKPEKKKHDIASDMIVIDIDTNERKRANDNQ